MEYVVFDLETTGMSPGKDGIVEIGAVRVSGGEVLEQETFHTLVNPERPIPYFVSRIHGLFDHHVKGAPTLDRVLPDFLEWIGPRPVVAHNASFDVGFIRANAEKYGLAWNPVQLCTVQLSRKAFPGVKGHKLDDLAQRFDLRFTERHRSMGDVLVTAQAFVQLSKRLALEL